METPPTIPPPIQSNADSGIRLDPAAPSRPPKARFWASLFLLYVAVSIGIQGLSGIYRSEFSHLPDEAAHVVTSLMIRDFLVSGFREDPRLFAENYYVHYPKIAIGMWPPFFHASAGAWMAIFSPSRTSLLLLIAAQTALLALLLAVAGARLFHPLAAASLGLLLLFVPQVKLADTSVMVDTWVAVLEFAAVFWLVDYFRTARLRAAVCFGLLAGLAMMTKGNGDAIVLVAFLMLALTRRFDLLRRPGLYVAAAIAAVVGLPWQWISWRILQTSVPVSRVDSGRIVTLAAGYGQILLHELSLPVCAVGLLGLAVVFVRIFRRSPRKWSEADLLESGILSLLIAVFAFHCFVPIPGPEPRYMLPAFAAGLLLFAAGLYWTAGRLRLILRLPSSAGSLAAVAALLLFVAAHPSIPRREPLGFMGILDPLLQSKPGRSAILICSDVEGEGALISEVAFRDRRPGTIVLRGSKILSESPWDGMSYKPLLHTPAEVQAHLDSVPVDSIVIDLSAAMWAADRQLLLDTMRQYPALWTLVPGINPGGAGHSLLVYRRSGSESDLRPKHLSIHMPFTLGKDLSLR